MSLQTAAGTRALMDLEDAAPDVLFENIPGSSVPFWPQVRTEFMVALQDLDFDSVVVPSPAPSRGAAWRGLVRAMMPSPSDVRGLVGARSIVHLAGGTTVHRVAGRQRNWLVGDYLEAYPQRSALLTWAEPSADSPAFEPTRSLSALVTRSAAYARVSRTRRRGALDKVGALVREYARLIDAPIPLERIDRIAESAAYAETSRPHVEDGVMRVMDRLAPEIVVFDNASYGGWPSILAQLKRCGVYVVEPQHGWIGPTHGAYNFGRAMSAPEMFQTLPDELLAFGDYWTSGLRTPYPSTSIGKPYLESAASRVPAVAVRPREILVVSSIADPDATSTFVRTLASALPGGWTVRFRPHPIERATLSERYAPILGDPRVSIDENVDLYDTLAAVRAVIGVASTVLFEAVAFGCRVFARDSAFAPYYVGDLFGRLVEGPDDVETVVTGLREEGAQFSQALLESIWKPGAGDNFRAWMDARFDV